MNLLQVGYDLFEPSPRFKKDDFKDDANSWFQVTAKRADTPTPPPEQAEELYLGGGSTEARVFNEKVSDAATHTYDFHDAANTTMLGRWDFTYLLCSGDDAENVTCPEDSYLTGPDKRQTKQVIVRSPCRDRSITWKGDFVNAYPSFKVEQNAIAGGAIKAEVGKNMDYNFDINGFGSEYLDINMSCPQVSIDFKVKSYKDRANPRVTHTNTDDITYFPENLLTNVL